LGGRGFSRFHSSFEMRIVKQALLYFALVFGAGFILGPIRILLVIPRVGVRVAELMEAPIMLMVTIAASRWTVRRFPEPSNLPSRLAMGFLALALMLGAEFSLAYALQRNSVGEYLANRDPVSGTVYYALLIVFAALPAYWSHHARQT
jgi:hypothetical protein